MTKQKYAVGDKVRVVKTIHTTTWNGYNVGDIFEVADAYSESVSTVNGPNLWHEEIERVTDKPTKKQRITDLETTVKSLENDILALQAEVAALKKAKATPKFVPVTTDNIAVGDKIRVINADNIGPAVLTNGKVYEVELLCTDGDFYVVDDEGDRMSIVESEFPYVEKVVSE